MSYGLAYTLPFVSFSDKKYRVEIEKEGYSGEVINLQGLSSPFITEIKGEDFIYSPTRLSTAKMRIFGDENLQKLFATDYRMSRVTLLENEIPVWCGFIVPELYSQEYNYKEEEVEVPCQSAMSVLDFIDYKQQDSTKRRFISLWQLLKLCIRESRGRYRSVYIPHVYGKDLQSFSEWSNPLSDMIIAEQNFFDESDKPMKLLEILEEIMKFLNWVCCDWGGDLYFIDVDNKKGEYFKYNPQLATYTKYISEQKSIQDIGYTGLDNTLDIIPGYNKAIVRCSNYPVGKLVPEEDFDKLKVIKRPDDLSKKIDKKTEVINHSLVLEGNEYITFQYDNNNQHIEHPTGEDYDSLGATLVKRCNYERNEENGNWKDSISSYSYDNLVRIRTKSADGLYQLPPNVYENTPILKFKTSTSEVIYAKGALALDFSGQICINSDMGVYKDKLPDSANMEVPVLVRLGNKYWSNWNNTWSDDPYFILVEMVGKDMQSGGFAQIEDTKTVDMPYDNLRGIIMEIPQDMKGDIELSIYKPQAMDLGNSAFDAFGFYLKDVSLKYERAQKTDVYEDNADRTYENIVNENFINELEEIEFKISSYNNDGACYSKVSFTSGGYLENNLYCGIVNEQIRPEELLIRRIINYYSNPKYKIRQHINLLDLKPNTRMTINSIPNKEFFCLGGTIDYSMSEYKGQLFELE